MVSGPFCISAKNRTLARGRRRRCHQSQPADLIYFPPKQQITQPLGISVAKSNSVTPLDGG
jgi:hypothetical protein